MPATLLEARGLSAGYGSSTVVRDLDLTVEEGEVVALLGPNGAGKSTTLLALAGELQPRGGEVRLRGERTRRPTHQRARAGLGFITEERSVFMRLTVSDNLRLAGLRPEEALQPFPELLPFLARKAGDLSGGQQQILALARMLARKPAILLADELSFGLAPMVVRRLLAAIRTAASERGLGALIVEQHIRQVLEVADRAYVLSQGEVTMSGPVAEIRERLDEVEASYLTTSAADRA